MNEQKNNQNNVQIQAKQPLEKHLDFNILREYCAKLPVSQKIQLIIELISSLNEHERIVIKSALFPEKTLSVKDLTLNDIYTILRVVSHLRAYVEKITREAQRMATLLSRYGVGGKPSGKGLQSLMEAIVYDALSRAKAKMSNIPNIPSEEELEEELEIGEEEKDILVSEALKKIKSIKK